MNEPLVTAIKSGMSLDNRSRIIEMIRDSHAADSRLWEGFDTPEFSKIVNIAIGMVTEATKTVASDPEPDKKWERLIDMSTINAGLNEMVRTGIVRMENPALINYTQVVMLITAAILTERKETK